MGENSILGDLADMNWRIEFLLEHDGAGGDTSQAGQHN